MERFRRDEDRVNIAPHRLRDGSGCDTGQLQTVMHDTGRGFNPDFEASDHQMVEAVMTFG